MNVNFHQTISKLLSTKLEEYKNLPLDKNTCIKIYQSIFETMSELFKRVNAPVGNESVNYVAQQYYDSILINDSHELDPNIFTQRAKLDNISTKELAFIAILLAETDFRLPILVEIKHRQ